MPPKVPEIQAVYNQSAFWTQAAAALATKFCPKIAFQFHIKKQQNKVTILIWTEQSTHPHCEMIWNSNAACFWSKKHVFGYIKCINNTKTAASPMENKSQISHVGHNWHARLKHLHAKDLFSRKGANAARLGYGSGLVSFLHKGLRGRALFEWLKHSDPPTHPPLERNFGDHWMDVVTRNCKSWTWNRAATPCFDPQGLKHKCIEVWTMWRVTWSAHVCYTSDMCVSSHDCKDSDKNAAVCFVPKGVSRNSTEHGVHVSKWNGNATLFSICACHPGTCE